ncbi:hypothetical protein HID58_048738, partial [Brassica napus]
MEKRGWEQSTEKGDTDYFVFKARVDRHGRHFGDRVSTRQTRVPPPAPTTNAMNPSKSSWSQKPLYEEPEQYSSPQYTHSRQTNYRETRRGRDLFSQRSQGQWRAKKPDFPEAMRLYLSCPGSAEAATRRQRVLQGDALGQTEERAATIIVAETRKHAMIPHYLRDESNPNTPPPNQDFHLNELLSLNPSTTHSPLVMESEVDITPRRTTEGHAKLKSIIISPSLEPEQEAQTQQEPVEQSHEEETLKEFQNKVKRRVRKPTQARLAGNSPNILRGASSKKRNISQIQNSPARGAGPSKRANTTTQKKANNDKAA